MLLKIFCGDNCFCRTSDNFYLRQGISVSNVVTGKEIRSDIKIRKMLARGTLTSLKARVYRKDKNTPGCIRKKNKHHCDSKYWN